MLIRATLSTSVKLDHLRYSVEVGTLFVFLWFYKQIIVK